MQLKFKKNYNNFFVFFLTLVIIASVLTFYPNLFKQFEDSHFSPSYIYAIIWLNVFALSLAFFSFGKKAILINCNHLTIKRSLIKNQVINFEKISNLQQNNNGKIFLMFGSLPSLTITYTKKNKLKKMIFRSDKVDLMHKLLSNEKDIKNMIIKNSLN